MKIGISITAEVNPNDIAMITLVMDKESIAIKTKDTVIYHWSAEVIPHSHTSQQLKAPSEITH